MNPALFSSPKSVHGVKHGLHQQGPLQCNLRQGPYDDVSGGFIIFLFQAMFLEFQVTLHSRTHINIC